MARPGYNDDNSLNVSKGYTPRNTGNNNSGNQQSRNQTANELDRMINNSGNTGREQGIMQNASSNIPRDIPRVTQTQTQNLNNGFNGYLNANQQMAASLMNAGALTSGALGGTALWQLPESYFTEQELNSGINPENTFHSTFVEGQQAYSPTGILTIEGENGIPAYIGRDEDGNLIPNPDPLANNYKIFNPYGGGGGRGGGGGGGGGYGGGGGSGDSLGYMDMGSQGGVQGNPNEAWGRQNSLQQAMIDINAPKGFQQGYARGGLVSLVR